MLRGFGFLGDFISMGLWERARPRAHRHAPSRGDGKNPTGGRWNFSESGAGRTRRRPSSGALPGTGRYRATFR